MKNILRWIAVLPVFLLAYAVVKIVYSFTTYPFLPELVGYLTAHKDFGSHFILGPIFIFSRECISTVLAMVAAQKTAPPGKERIAWIITACVMLGAGIWAIHLTPSPSGLSFRTFLEIAAAVIGLTVAFFVSPIHD